MKRIILAIVIFSSSIVACNDKESKETSKTDTTQASTTNNATEKQPVSMDEVITGYLALKNALVKDNGNDAADAAKSVNKAWKAIDEASLTPEQKTVYDDVKEDILEHSEHIGDNAGKISHQREHFDWLSNAMSDLLKVFKTKQALYKDHCPMYNDGKGAIWISESKEIKNPYYGKKMITCGSVKEEIK